MALLLLLTACTFPLNFGVPPDDIVIPTAAALPTVTALPADTSWLDANAPFADVCFNYWVEQTGRVFVFTSNFDLIQFYNEVDEAELCRFAVERSGFDFNPPEGARVIVGAVNVATGCWAFTDPLALVQDDRARSVTVRVGWGSAGDCGYRLARPFFVSIPAPPAGYTVGMAFLAAEGE
ncbi:MAG: hypothetical protein JW910_05095 [Anaerolineae bacterium]|nr:hypothetical protein [Anaerolineae bacterium]